MVMGITSLYPNVASVQNNRYLPSTGGGASETIADSAELLRRLDDAFREFQALKDNNIEMKKIISHYISSTKNNEGELGDGISNNDLLPPDLLASLNKNDNSIKPHNNGEPSVEYEKTRRLLELDLKEFWYNVRSKNLNIGETDMKQIEEVYKYVGHLILVLEITELCLIALNHYLMLQTLESSRNNFKAKGWV